MSHCEHNFTPFECPMYTSVLYDIAFRSDRNTIAIGNRSCMTRNHHRLQNVEEFVTRKQSSNLESIQLL